LPVTHIVKKEAIERNQVVCADEAGEGNRVLVGCGHPLPGQNVVIVNPESLAQSPPDEIGEIWVSGTSVARGYWGRSTETEQTFHARIAPTGQGPFLRTGDLGFLHDGELYISGRLKDLIIIRGRNYYPQDIELVVEQSHQALRPGCGAAFSIEAGENGEERLVVVQEVKRRHRRNLNATEVAAAIRKAVAEEFELPVHAVVLIQTMSIPKTSSGKVRRFACRAEFLAGTLNVIAESILEDVKVRDEDEDLLKTLLATRLEGRRPLLVNYIRTQIARPLGIDPDSLDSEQPLSDIGLDSLRAVELTERLQATLNISLPTTLVFDYPTIDALADFLILNVLPPLRQSATGQDQVIDSSQAQVRARVERLSEDEAEALLLNELEKRGL
jgi:acyl carrier protein